MYDVEIDSQKARMTFQDETVLSGIAPVLSLDDGSVVRPDLVDHSAEEGSDRLGGYVLHRLTYRDVGETLELALTFRAYTETMVVSATFSALKGGTIGARAKGLAAFGGLRLEVDSLGDVAGLMANYLHKDWWTRPHFGADIHTIPPRTQSIVWKTGTLYHHLLAVADDVLKTEILGTDAGVAILTAAYAPGYWNLETVMFAVSSGASPFDLPERNATAGMHALGTPYQLRWKKRYPEPFEYLGWCSWNAFYRQVTAEGMLAKAQEFRDLEIPVRWMIVDDGWMRHVDTALTAFEPDADKFPEGFAPFIDALKRAPSSDDAGVAWLGVWHTLCGYWQGVHPGSDLARDLAGTLHTTRTGKVVPAPDAAKAFAFWDAWHTQLRSAGVDFVKVDCQSGLPAFWQQELAIGTAAVAAHDAIEASVGKSFGNTMINCMGMAGESIWHRSTSAVNRNSDDFFPDDPDSFVEHALQNAYNAYYHAPFMWLDWDMWWTKHTHAATHAVLRAISGGPVYVSDRVGETDPTQLWPMILSDGRLLRCDRPGIVTEDCLLQDPSHDPIPLKLWSTVGGTGVVAAVNVSLDGETVSGTISPSDVPGLLGERFVVYEHFGETAAIAGCEDEIPLSLPPNASALYTIIPVDGAVTPIGLVDKYLAVAAIADWLTAGDRTTVVLLDGGRFAWAAETAPVEVRVNGEIVQASSENGVYTVDCSGLRGSVWVEIVTQGG